MKKTILKSLFGLTSLILGLSTMPAMAQKNAETAAKDVEVITVQGQRPVAFFVREYERAKFAMYEAYNKVNTIPKFSVDCRIVKPIGTQIAKRECLPRFFRDETAYGAQMFMLGGAKAYKDDQQWVATLTKEDQKAFYQHIEDLSKESPELLAHLMNISNKLEALLERKTAQ